MTTAEAVIPLAESVNVRKQRRVVKTVPAAPGLAAETPEMPATKIRRGEAKAGCSSSGFEGFVPPASAAETVVTAELENFPDGEVLENNPEGKRSAMIVAKAVREHVKTNYQMHLNAAVLQKMNTYIQTLIWKGAQRAKANGRKTIKTVDM